MQKIQKILCKFCIIITKKVPARTEPSHDAILEKLREQHQPNSPEKYHIQCKLGAYSMHILVGDKTKFQVANFSIVCGF